MLGGSGDFSVQVGGREMERHFCGRPTWAHIYAKLGISRRADLASHLQEG